MWRSLSDRDRDRHSLSVDSLDAVLEKQARHNLLPERFGEHFAYAHGFASIFRAFARVAISVPDKQNHIAVLDRILDLLFVHCSPQSCDRENQVGLVPLMFRSWATAVTSWAGANGFVKRTLFGTPCEAHSAALSPVI